MGRASHGRSTAGQWRLWRRAPLWYEDRAMFPRLFAPLALKRVTLRNRIVSTPHSDGMAEAGLVTDRLIAYFRAKARGGAGLVMGPAGCAVHPTSPTRAGGLE